MMPLLMLVLHILKYWDTTVEVHTSQLMDSMKFFQNSSEVLSYASKARSDFQQYLSEKTKKA